MKYWTYVGNVNNDTASSAPLDIGDSLINYFIITNKSGGVATINIMIQEDDGDGLLINISPYNQQLAVGECYTDRNLVIRNRTTIFVQSDSNVDFYFAVSNDNSPVDISKQLK
jgi:hypothetical protein